MASADSAFEASCLPYWSQLQPYLHSDGAEYEWDSYDNPLQSPLIRARALAARASIVERVIDSAVVRMIDLSGVPSCVPFIRVKWAVGGQQNDTTATSAAAAFPLAPSSHWMPLWCFHPLAVDNLRIQVATIEGNHSQVMLWLLDTVSEACPDCRGLSRCSLHVRPPLEGGVATLATKSDGTLNSAPSSAYPLDGMTYLRPRAGWSPRAPGAFLLPAFRVLEHISKIRTDAVRTVADAHYSCSAASYTRAATIRNNRTNVFGHNSAQRFLRGVFDVVGTRGISVAEARNAFLAEAGELALLPVRSIPRASSKQEFSSFSGGTSGGKRTKLAVNAAEEAEDDEESDDDNVVEVEEALPPFPPPLGSDPQGHRTTSAATPRAEAGNAAAAALSAATQRAAAAEHRSEQLQSSLTAALERVRRSEALLATMATAGAGAAHIPQPPYQYVTSASFSASGTGIGQCAALQLPPMMVQQYQQPPYYAPVGLGMMPHYYPQQQQQQQQQQQLHFPLPPQLHQHFQPPQQQQPPLQLAPPPPAYSFNHQPPQWLQQLLPSAYAPQLAHLLSSSESFTAAATAAANATAAPNSTAAQIPSSFPATAAFPWPSLVAYASPPSHIS